MQFRTMCTQTKQTTNAYLPTMNSQSSIFVTNSVDGTINGMSQMNHQYTITMNRPSSFDHRKLLKAGTLIFVRDTVGTPYTYIGKIKTIMILMNDDKSYRICFRSNPDRRSGYVCSSMDEAACIASVTNN